MKRSSLPLLISWLVLIAGGVLVNRLSPLRPAGVKPVWVAARDLPVNSYLTVDDLKEPEELADVSDLPALDELVGKYLWVDKQTGKEVKASDLRDRPKIPDTAVTYLYPLASEETGLAEVLVPGDWVRVCSISETDGDPPCRGPFYVIAIHTGAASEERWLLLNVAGQEASLVRVLGAQQHVVLRLLPTEGVDPKPSEEKQ